MYTLLIDYLNNELYEIKDIEMLKYIEEKLSRKLHKEEFD